MSAGLWRSCRSPTALSPATHPATHPVANPASLRQRPMRSDDLDAALSIEQAAHAHPWTRGNFADALAAGYLAELLEDARGTPIGFVLAMHGFEETHLLNLAVIPAAQGQGHGRAMLAGLARHARQRGDRLLWLEVRPSNLPAQQLYRSAGFDVVGLRRGYYPATHGAREDALVMRLRLDQDANDAKGEHAHD